MIKLLRDMRRFTGAVDPGQAGGIAVYDSETGKVTAWNMPETYPDIFGLISGIRNDYPDIMFIMENVGHGMPGQSSAATAKFARHNGHLEMALFALDIRTELVTPQKWMRYYSNTLGKSSQYTKTEWKNRLKGEAQRRFPTAKATLKTADAILMAYYGAVNVQ